MRLRRSPQSCCRFSTISSGRSMWKSNVESTESDEFRHFLSGVDLIYKQLTGVLEALGVKPIVGRGHAL